MKRSILFVIVSTIGVIPTFGRDVIEIESRYTGNGCFQYTLRTLEDPFVSDIGFANLIPRPFTNYVSNTLPPHWTNYFADGEWSGIAYDASGPALNLGLTKLASPSSAVRRPSDGNLTGFKCGFRFSWPTAFNSVISADTRVCLLLFRALLRKPMAPSPN